MIIIDPRTKCAMFVRISGQISGPEISPPKYCQVLGRRRPNTNLARTNAHARRWALPGQRSGQGLHGSGERFLCVGGGRRLHVRVCAGPQIEKQNGPGPERQKGFPVFRRVLVGKKIPDPHRLFQISEKQRPGGLCEKQPPRGGCETMNDTKNVVPTALTKRKNQA